MTVNCHQAWTRTNDPLQIGSPTSMISIVGTTQSKYRGAMEAGSMVHHHGGIRGFDFTRYVGFPAL